jgi:hypothetical protein
MVQIVSERILVGGGGWFDDGLENEAEEFVDVDLFLLYLNKEFLESH